MKFLIDNFGTCNLFGRPNYEYYARITGRILKVEDEWIFSFRFPPDNVGRKCYRCFVLYYISDFSVNSSYYDYVFYSYRNIYIGQQKERCYNDFSIPTITKEYDGNTKHSVAVSLSCFLLGLSCTVNLFTLKLSGLSIYII